MKFFRTALILGLFVLLCSVNLSAATCTTGDSGKVKSLEQAYCGLCAYLLVTMDNCSFNSLPIMGSNFNSYGTYQYGTQSQALLLYAMDRQKTVTVTNTNPTMTFQSACGASQSCAFSDFSVTY